MDEEPEKPKVLEGSSEPKSKRKMKTAFQLQLLEKTYAMETYPSEQIRAELSVQLGLSDRQLQMWFCHRRLKDRKKPKAAVETAERSGVAVARISGGDVAVRAVAFVEAQLGEKVREDGPILGMEFDPLPPGAFGMPLGTTSEGQHKLLARHFEANLYERPDMNPVKVIQGASRALQEYQFLPQQPSVKAEMHERASSSSYQYGSPADVHSVKTAVLTSARPLVHADERVSPGYGFPSPVPSLNLMPQEGRQGHVLLTAAGEYETLSHKNSYANIVDAQLSSHPITALEMSSDRRVVHEEDVLRIERKRKSEEARIAREVEAHEKRIRKELEKQDILRRKRDEQMRKELERIDRERRKEEERLLREKQREEERYLREKRREMERREKFLQKESIRAEKMRQKEELRREKEAARQKAASERAIAKRMAKESMELVDDERLELMELAASSKGLPSVISLDFETLQNLHLFRDKLTDFPPNSVLLKKPFAIQPWNLSEENVGNLLMTWRFLITFVDVLEIWPFTLDEFVQALHDYDPRLLGEIHIALLKIIIKDIEDVARTPATGLGTNQNSAVNLGGGHPEVVEGAYAWGFDLRSWHRYLNPLSWPEILRQFALSAGFGPLLKKKNADEGYIRDENEGNDCEDVVSNLRSGAAVENAVAIMQERGFSNPRRSRHCLTPGTVKYAAFHVLSLEGSRGLTILEVADRIQRSGLRDLSTSKTPEASISAALSRDTKLFERTAPSTYCVRFPYRKDPADAEAILVAARERIRAFKSDLADEQDAEDAERDDDSESDATEDPEIDDLRSEVNLKKKDHDSPGSNTDHHSLGKNKLNMNTSLINEKERDETIKTPQRGPKNTVKVVSSMHTGGSTEVNGVGPSVADVSGFRNILESAGEDVDESRPGEPWVHGLMEGEYSDLSVEERLSALVSLIGVTLEGNSIRLVLEERLEAANALKKQMWAEAQLDKRRVKEEYVMRMHYPSYAMNKMEPNLALSVEGRQGRRSPSVTVDEKTNEVSVATPQQERLSNTANDINVQNMATEASLQVQDLSAAPDNFIYQTPGNAAEMSRSQLKSLVGHKAEEMYVYRSLPLGQDRRRNRYWQFITSASHNDPGCGRIFVELHDGRWRLVDSLEGFDALLSSLDVRGLRESHLHMMLQKIEISFKDAIRRKKLHSHKKTEDGDIKEEVVKAAGSADYYIADSRSSAALCSADSDASKTSTSFTIEIGENQSERTHMLNRYHDFENWMWRECANSSLLCAMKYGKKRCKPLLGACDNCHHIYFLENNQCPCQKPHETTGNNLYMVRCEDKLKMVASSNLHGPASPLRIRLLKLLLALIEVSILPEAIKPLWSKDLRELWGMKLHSSSTAEELLQIFSSLEGAIERDYLSSDFETASDLMDSSNLSGNLTVEKVAVLPWLPATTAALALRVMEFDASISYMLNQDVGSRREKGNGEYIKLASKYAVIKKSQNAEMSKTPDRPALLHEENRAYSRTGLAGLSRAQARRSKNRSRRSGKSQKKASGSRLESGKRSSASKSDRLGQVLVWKGQSRAQVEHKRGRRSARSRQKAVKQTTNIAAKLSISKESTYRQSMPMYKQSQIGLARDTWNQNKTNETKLQMEMAENASSSEKSEYDFEIDQASGDDYDDAAVNNYTISFNGSKSGGFLGESDYNADANVGDDDDEEEEDEDGDEQEDMDARGYTGYAIDSELVGDGEEDQNKDPDEEMDTSLSEYSD